MVGMIDKGFKVKSENGIGSGEDDRFRGGISLFRGTRINPQYRRMGQLTTKLSSKPHFHSAAELPHSTVSRTSLRYHGIGNLHRETFQ